MPANKYLQATVVLGAASIALSVSAQSLLEEVIVTATKRSESLQDVSVAVTALPDWVLEGAQITEASELVNLVPSLNLQEGGNPRSSSFNIRGIGTQSFSSLVEPSVSTLVDGVVMGQTGMAFQQLLDLERVEVLRGPQGTLFGKNSSAGAVHFITRNPSDEFEAAVKLSAIERGEYNASFSVSGPLSDTLGYRFTGFGSMNDGHIRNEFDGQQINDSDEFTLRAKLRYQPSDTLDIVWTADMSHDNANCCVSSIRSAEPFNGVPPTVGGVPLADVVAPVVPGLENTRVNSNGDNTTDIESHGVSMEINFDLAGHTLTSITAYRDWSQFAPQDADALPVDPLGFYQEGFSEQDQFSQELRLTSAADQKISYILGAFYFDQQVDRYFTREFRQFADIGLGTATADFTTETNNYAAFAQATWNFSDRFRAIVGGRYTSDEVSFDFVRGGETLGATPTPFFAKSNKETDFSGKLALEFDLNDETLTYLSFVQGFKGPAYNVGFGSRPDNTDPVAPETSDAFELGLKTSFFDGRLILNAALFHSEYTDFQAQSAIFIPELDANGNNIDANGDGNNDGSFSFVLGNVGKVQTQGLELDFLARPTEAWTINGGLAFIDAEIKSFPGGPCTFGQDYRNIGFRGTGCEGAPALQDLTGGELPQSPDFKITLGTVYNVALESLPFSLVLGGQYRYQDDVQFGIQQDVNTVQEAYGVLDLNIGLASDNETYSATLFVKNVLDEFYVTGIGSQTNIFIPNGYIHRVPKTARRTAGIEVKYRF